MGAIVGGVGGALGCADGVGAPLDRGEQASPGSHRRAVGRPIPVASAVNSEPETGASPIAGAAVDARALIITADETNSAFEAIRSTLQYLGSPFDVLDATAGPPLTTDSLASGSHGKYNAVFLDMGGLETSSGSAFTDAEWNALATYEAEFKVRRVSLYTSPSAAYGLEGDMGIDPAKAPVAMSCTPAGTAALVGTNCANPIVLDGGYAYPATVLDAVTVPLLVDPSGNVFAATRSYPDGREALALTFAPGPSLMAYLEIAYGVVDWATRGLFVGERHVYADPQLDDLFLASSLYTGGTYRITDVDLQSLADWQTRTRAMPLTANFRLAWAVNGQGSQLRPGDPLTAKAVALGPTFSWINHTWDHPILDGLSYADVLAEFTHNDMFLRGLGLAPYTTANAVTPSVSGLGSADAMRAIYDVGIRQIVSDTSVTGQGNPSPNLGLWNALQPSVFEIPRIPAGVGFDVSQPSEWLVQYQATKNSGVAVDYPTVLDRTSDNILRYLLQGNNDPWMFHQANARDYDGAGHSLLSDLFDATFTKYATVATFPIVSCTMDELATRIEARMALDASGVTATVQPGVSLTVSVVNAATVPVTGLCTPGAESYGGQTISYLSLSAGQSVTVSLAGCSPGPEGTGGSSGDGNGSSAGPATSVGGQPMAVPNGGGCSCAVNEGPTSAGAVLVLGLWFLWVGGGRRVRRSGA